MTAILSKRLRSKAALELYSHFRDMNTNLYFYWAKSSPWNIDNDDKPDPIDSVNKDIKFNNDLILVKKVKSSNVTLCFRRNDWKINKVYNEYDYEKDMTLLGNYYVITDEFKVYKCLKNNNGSASTIKPTNTSLDPFETSDGYVWKYMFTVGVNAAKLFLSEFVPVDLVPNSNSSQHLVMSSAINGSIDSYKITNQGQGYSTISLEIIGDGEGAKALAFLEEGKVKNVRIVNRGRDYTWAKVIINGNGSGAEISPQISPLGGHGSNPIDELGANYLMTVGVLGDENESELINIPFDFDFRKLGLVTNLTETDSGDSFTSNIGSGCLKLYVVNHDFFERGDIIVFDNGSDGIIVSKDVEDDRNVLYVNEVDNLVSEQYPVNSIAKSNDASVFTQISQIVYPDIKVSQNVDIYYLDYLDKIYKSKAQRDITRIIFEF